MSESRERTYEKRLVKRLIIKAKKRARRRENAIFLNAGIMGIFGWHIVIPVIICSIIGISLDRLCKTGSICFISLMLLGLLAGGYNAYRWVKKNMVLKKKEEEIVLESEKQQSQSTGEE